MYEDSARARNCEMNYWVGVAGLMEPWTRRCQAGRRAPTEGESRTKVPHYLNDLPHYPLLLCSNLPNDHGHFDDL